MRLLGDKRRLKNRGMSPARVEDLIPGLAEAPGLPGGTHASIVTSGPCDHSCLRAIQGLAHVIAIEESWERIRDHHLSL
jgi:hypothetical protein